MIEYNERIIYYTVKTLEHFNSLNDKNDCLKVMPKIVKDEQSRAKLYASRADSLMAKLLKQKLNFNQEIDNEIMMNILLTFSIVVEEEYQKFKDDKNIIILKGLVNSEELIDVLVNLLQRYLEIDRIHFVCFIKYLC